MPVEKFEDLMIWQLARELCKTIYAMVRKPEFKQDYRFVSQITAAVGSVMDNIAEGFERNGNKEFLNFLFIAKGSCGEVQSQLYRAYDCEYISKDEFEEAMQQAKAESVKIMNFIQYLKKSDFKGAKNIN